MPSLSDCQRPTANRSATASDGSQDVAASQVAQIVENVPSIPKSPHAHGVYG